MKMLQAGEEPPFLSVGTDVSAKYKGAFCEAKIKKVIRSVKCKVIFKNNLGTVVVPDDHVKGTLRVGAHIEAKHPEKNQFLEAIINKLHDHSQYTVVFDDGDETTLRRTSLCLKSGRHFAESETLDQLPLTHPEHFGTPVMGSKGRKRRSLTRSCINDDGSSDDDRISKKKDSKMKEPDPDIGKVVCVELGDKKKQKDNWFPALVVSPSAQDSIRINSKEEYLVRSFKDGRYYTVTKKDARDFTREIGSKVDNNTLKTAVEKALMYTEGDELPPHWDRELLFGMDESTDEDSASDSDSDSSDDEPSEEKDRFVAQLYKFMDDRGTPINKAPAVGNRDLNLYKLFKVVQKLGGYNRVTNHMQWKTVYTKMGLPSYNTSSSHQIKQAYKKYLHSFEDFYRKLGCTMGTSTRSGRMRHRSGRNIIMTRDRDREFKAAGRRSSKQDNKDKKKDDKLKNKDEDRDKTKSEDSKDKADVKKSKHDTSREVKSKGDGGKELTHDKDDLSIEEEKEKDKPKAKEEKKHKNKDDHKKEKISEKKQKVDKESKGNKNKSDDVESNVDIKKEKREQFSEGDVLHNKETKDEKPLSEKPEKDSSEKGSTKATKLEKANKSKTEKESKETKLEKETKSDKAKHDKETKNEKKEKVGKDGKEGKLEKSEKVKAEKDKDFKAEKVKTDKGNKEGKSDKLEKVKHIKDSKSKLDKEDKHSPEKETTIKEERIKVEKESKFKIETDDKDESKKPKEEKIKPKLNKDDDSKLKCSPPAFKRGRKKSGRDESHGDGKEDTTDEGDSWTDDIDIGVGDKVRVKYGRGRQQKIYEAKVLELEEEDGEKHFYVHYTGWNMRYDEWVKRPRIVENLSQKARKGRSAGSPKMLSLKGLPSKRGRPSLSKSPMHMALSKKHSGFGQPTRPRSTRSDRNSLVDSPFVNGLEPRKRIRKSSGLADHSTDNLKDSDDDESDSEHSDSDTELSIDISKEMEQLDDDKSLLIPDLRNECDEQNLDSDNEEVESKAEEEVESKVRKKGRKNKEKSPGKNDDETIDESINEIVKKEKDKTKLTKKLSKNKVTDDDSKTRSKSKQLKKNKGKSIEITDDEESSFLDETPTRTRNKKSKQRDLEDNSDEKESEKDHEKHEDDDERCEIDDTDKKKKKSKRLSRSKMHENNDDKKESDSFQGTPPKTKVKGRKKTKKLKDIEADIDIDLDEGKLDITESEIEPDDEKEDNKEVNITVDEKTLYDSKCSDEVEDLKLNFDKNEEILEVNSKMDTETIPSEVPKEDSPLKLETKQSENEEENIENLSVEILDETKDFFFTSSPKLEVEAEAIHNSPPSSVDDVKCNLDFFKEPPEPEPIPKSKRKEEFISDEEQNEIPEEKPKGKSEKRKKSKLEKLEDDTDESEAEGKSKKSKKKGRSKREKESDDESTELSELENEVKRSKQKTPKSLRSKKSKIEDETPLCELSIKSEPSPQKINDSYPILEVVAEINEKQPELTELESDSPIGETEEALELKTSNLVISEDISENNAAEIKVPIEEAVEDENDAEILPTITKIENITEASPPETLKLCTDLVVSKEEVEAPSIDNVKMYSDVETGKSDECFKSEKVSSGFSDIEIKEEPVHKESKKEKKSKPKSVKKEDGSDIDTELRSEEEYKKKKMKYEGKDEEKKSKEGKQKKSKDKKGKSKKDDSGDKECKDLDKKSDKIKKKENKKKKDAEKLKKQEKEDRDSDMESIECIEFVKKKEKKNKKNKTDKSKDDEPEKKKSKKKSGKEQKSDKDGNEDDKEFKENKKLSKKGDQTSKSLKKEKKKDKNKRESSSSDDHDAIKYKGEKEHSKKAEKKLKLESVKEKTFFPKQDNPDFIDSDDANLLFCKEDVPISPIAGDALPSKIEFNLPAVQHNDPVCTSPASYLIPSSSHSLPSLNECSHTLQAFLKHEPESSTVLDNTPPTTPESALSTLSESPIREKENNSLLCDEESTKSGRESVNEIDMDSFNEVRKHVCHENIDFAQSEAAMVLGSMGVQGFEKRLQLPASPTNKRPKADIDDSSPIKKRKKSNRRSHNMSDSHKSGSSLSRQRHSSSKSNKGPASQLLVLGELIQQYHLKISQSPSDGSPDVSRICSSLQENQGSDSDETSPHDRIPSHNLMGSNQPSLCSSSNSSSSSSICDKEVTVYTAAPRSPRPSKFNFFVELDEYSDGAERIAVLQEKLTELRKTYMALKAEVACIDRRRKKLKRKEKEAAAASSTTEVECS